SFVLDLRLDPSLDYMVRVSGRLDTVSGVVSWDFITLDTLTENIPFLDGFLPPNVNSPEGEGSVYYSILPKQALPSGTQIQSQASILFDSNPAINTNLWVNQTDEDAPASTMSASVVNDTLISLALNGADAVSGVEGYRIFVSKNGEPFTSLFTVGNEPQELTGTPGDTYAFYCEAIDSAGNQEHKPALAEATVNMPVGISDLNEEMAVFRIQPNPNNGQFVIVTEKNIRNARLEVCTIEGKVVFTESFSSEADEAFPVLLDILPSGMYLVSISTSKGVYQAQRLLLVK
ncbi:MAG: T9SS type A sorting domain-containing protein, partial [Bacteroidetes bacterium]|nr:T9SS type A sorting domain-containing protein [Bacteroidota bacterium]